MTLPAGFTEGLWEGWSACLKSSTLWRKCADGHIAVVQISKKTPGRDFSNNANHIDPEAAVLADANEYAEKHGGWKS